MLISRTEIRGSDLNASVLEVLEGDKEKYQVIEEYVLNADSLKCVFLYTCSLGLLSSTPVSLAGTPLRALASHLETKLELG